MIRAAASSVAIALFATAAPSAAGEAAPAPVSPAPRGPEIALRVGASAPVGEAAASTGSLADVIALDVPVALELGWRFFAGHLHVGAYGQIGAIVARACTGEDAHCTGSDVRVGGLVAYHFAPRALVDPWVGLGMSFERLDVNRRADRRSLDLTASGLSFLDLHAGAAVAVAPSMTSLRVGPFVSGALGRFTRIAIDGEARTDFDAGYHAWFTFGLRGDFAP